MHHDAHPAAAPMTERKILINGMEITVLSDEEWRHQASEAIAYLAEHSRDNLAARWLLGIFVNQQERLVEETRQTVAAMLGGFPASPPYN